MIALDLFPEITIETSRRKEERREKMKNYRLKLGPKPTKKIIYKRNPTEGEISNAFDIIKNPSRFQLFDHGHVVVFDNSIREDNTKKIIADITFTNLTTLDSHKLEDINFLLSFLQQSKRFVRPVASEGRSCGGSMWAIGWRKSMKKLEIVGHYVDTEEIQKNQHEYNEHVAKSEKASEILWDLFYSIGNVALEANQQFMIEHNLPSFSDPVIPNEDTKGKNFFTSNLTFTSDGFFNHPHKDGGDDEQLPFAFLLCVPIRKSTGELAFEKDGYNVTDGQFVFPDCGFGIEFKPNTMVQMIFSQRLYTHGTLQPNEPGDFTKLGMSMQISKKTTNIFDRVLAQDFVSKTTMHIGDVPYILNSAKEKERKGKKAV